MYKVDIPSNTEKKKKKFIKIVSINYWTFFNMHIKIKYLLN